jgi:STE24 endopeptidase
MKAIHPLLDPERQRLARRYEKEKRKLGLIGWLLSFCLILGFYGTGLSAWAAGRFQNEAFLYAFFSYGALFLAVLTVFSLPLSFFNGYVHEHRWGFSNQTVKAWLWERFKSFVVGLVIFHLVLGLLLWVMALAPKLWWLIAGAGMAVMSVIFATLFPVVVLPIFNRYTPIEDEELTGALDEILSRGGLKSSGFFQQDMSRQTKKENAFLAGLGKTRRVVLADNLIANMNVPEIESIIAHEVGHFKHRHIWKFVGIGTFQQILIFFLTHQVMQRIFPTFLSSPRANLTLLPPLIILFGFFSGVLFGPLGQAISRRFERQADVYALDSVPNPGSFQTALAGLADRNLSNAYPAWWIKLLYYSHPPIGERLAMAEAHGLRSSRT